VTGEVTVFGTRLSADRRSAGLTQRELAERSGLSLRAVSNLELGRAKVPHPDTAHRLADALGLHGDSRAGFLAAAGRRLGGGAVGPVPGDWLNQAGGGPTQQNGGPAPQNGSDPVRGHSQASAVTPRQLPAPVPHFTGRVTDLANLNAVLDAARPGRPAGLMVAAIDGPPGVGKTALAVRWAHGAASEFPDGQLYVNLHGFGSSDEITPAATAIRGFLDALGIPAGRIPPDPESQAGLYRSLLVGKRVLVLLDNARDAAQVRPLLPGSPGCAVVVTSRNRLVGLAAAEGARLVTLDVLPDSEARELLTRRISARRARAEPDAVGELARWCGRLPLALAVAAARAGARPAMPLAAVAAELAGSASRLGALQTGDPVTDVRTVFSWSCQQLAPQPARLFRLLGVHPGPDITVAAAAALLGTGNDGAREALDALAMANLAAEHVPGRYCQHDLLRAYAAEQATADEPAAGRQAAIQRVLGYYLHTSHAAALLLNPHRATVLTLPPPCPGAVPERPAGHPQALAWFEAEHQVLLGCVSLAAETGSDACAWILPWAMTEFLDRRGHWHEWAATQRTALAAATRLGNVAGQAAAHRAIATACVRLTDYRQARTHLAACLRLRRQLGDRAGEALTRHSLGRVAEHQGRYADALRHERQALALFTDAGDQGGQALARNAVGWYHILLGRPLQARRFCKQALSLYRHAGDCVGQAQAWDSLGYAEHQLGRLDHATRCYQHALGIFRDLGELFGQADTLIRLGDTRAAAADLPAALGAWQQALDILEDLRHPDAAKARAKLRQHLGVHPRWVRPRGGGSPVPTRATGRGQEIVIDSAAE
jgi:tetratricopeptide (TPR) repeat protein/DNA-binding XRE family transcriptional regulator